MDKILNKTIEEEKELNSLYEQAKLVNANYDKGLITPYQYWCQTGEIDKKIAEWYGVKAYA